ncbi:MAG: hypothetical protein OH319_00175 [Candidatus Parvarchaeota archaeon]|nr:hypothetical protein [Candidatus Jingweiarchaeum tengchongense]MCW1298439.1 hypothetical protein [Candidatus Jingweiarchaeum tengchongense]MCW1300531.1 hypothetical protein [Candidatus Jingweiarchaeum tengchongense]MCW1304994.1 hypothetical protein [Candidatus Jingweiarchaeum tengchongense]MCW1306014.1 hypothetical protein [Candidatus Jingweiarchaeum tengchongense]
MNKPNSQIPPYTPSGCFIATVVYGRGSHKLKSFRRFRDKVLLRNKFGRLFISFYYRIIILYKS